MDADKLETARQKMRECYKKHEEKKKTRKLIVLTTKHIEQDIAFRKRRCKVSK